MAYDISFAHITFNPLIALAVFGATIVTDAVFVDVHGARSPHGTAFARRTGARSGICSPPFR